MAQKAQTPRHAICGGKPKLSLGKQEKLRCRRQFEQVYQRGQRINGPRLTLFFLPNQLQTSRLGLTVTKKRFKLSVRRHYIQRVLREAFRLNKHCFRVGYDLVLGAQRFSQKKINLSAVEQEILALAQKAGLLNK